MGDEGEHDATPFRESVADDESVRDPTLLREKVADTDAELRADEEE